MKKQLARQTGRRIRLIRDELDLSQKDFAARMGMSNTHLSAIERGEFRPGFYFFHQITKTYGVNPLYLLFGTGPVFLEPGFLDQPEEKKEQQPEPTRPAPPPADLDSGENTEDIRDMLAYFQKSPVVRFAVLGFFSKFIIENRDIIEDDISKHRGDDKDEAQGTG